MAKLKDLLNEDITTMGGVVTTKPFSNVDMGFKTTKLTDIVEDVYGQSTRKVNVKEFMSEVGNFNSFGNEIYREGNLKQLAEKLSRLAETAKQHTLQETEDWFDKITVNRNMRELTSLANSFKKVANESDVLQQRMSTLYEDMGNILGRYYEINDSITEEEKDKYEKFFRASLKKFGVKSPAELDKDKKKDFFNYVDKNYDAKIERD